MVQLSEALRRAFLGLPRPRRSSVIVKQYMAIYLLSLFWPPCSHVIRNVYTREELLLMDCIRWDSGRAEMQARHP